MEFALEWAELKGMEKGLSKDLEEESLLTIMVSEAIKSSAIEGEYYSREDAIVFRDQDRKTRFVNINMKGNPDEYKISLQWEKKWVVCRGEKRDL